MLNFYPKSGSLTSYIVTESGLGKVFWPNFHTWLILQHSCNEHRSFKASNHKTSRYIQALISYIYKA